MNPEVSKGTKEGYKGPEWIQKGAKGGAKRKPNGSKRMHLVAMIGPLSFKTRNKRPKANPNGTKSSKKTFMNMNA